MSLKEKLRKMKILKPLVILYKGIKVRMAPKQEDILDDVFKYYKKRFYDYSGAFNNGMVKDESYLFWLSHVIEKGLAMPNMRFGFGRDRVIELSSKLLKFSSEYTVNSSAYMAGVDVLREYYYIHEKNKYQLSDDIVESIKPFIKETYVSNTERNVYNPDSFFIHIDDSFEQFAESRHSVRNFSVEENVRIDELLECVKIAQSAPSACNRQPTRVHIISQKDSIRKCLAMQNGNRGFGELANKLLIVTGDLQTVLGAQEFFDLNTNVGIFLMNLSYALYHRKIAHCILNWYALPKEDKAMRCMVGIPDNENIVAFVVCGKVPESFKIAVSPRKDIESIVTCH